MKKQVKLKPCPFCGAEAEVRIINKATDEGGGYVIRCKFCPTTMGPISWLFSDARKRVGELWNRRAK